MRIPSFSPSSCITGWLSEWEWERERKREWQSERTDIGWMNGCTAKVWGAEEKNEIAISTDHGGGWRWWEQFKSADKKTPIEIIVFSDVNSGCLKLCIDHLHLYVHTGEWDSVKQVMLCSGCFFRKYKTLTKGTSCVSLSVLRCTWEIFYT